MYKSLETVCKALSFSGGLTLEDLLAAVIPADSPLSSLTPSMRRSLQRFQSIAGEDEVYDLTQNAFKRKRSCSTDHYKRMQSPLGKTSGKKDLKLGNAMYGTFFVSALEYLTPNTQCRLKDSKSYIFVSNVFKSFQTK